MKKSNKNNTKLKKKILSNQKLLTDSQKNEIKKAFDTFDVTGAGYIEYFHIKVVLRALGFNPSEEEINKLIALVKSSEDNDKNKIIDFQEFLEIMIIKMSEKDSIDDIKKAFYLFAEKDESNNIYYISKDSLKKSFLN